MATTHSGREQTSDGLVEAYPEKVFFTDMLTRDIELKYAILDLLDNCFDGITRSIQTPKPSAAKPYAHYWVNITFDAASFSIEDNCGGIPRHTALHYAFKFGNKHEAKHLPRTVGFYGIGMKRAIFKMGRRATVISQYSDTESLTVRIPADWVKVEKWGFPYSDGDKELGHKGTRIIVQDLRPSISDAFSDRTGFVNDLEATVKRYYSRIIERGLRVAINGRQIPAEAFRLLVPSLLLKNGAPSRETLRDSIVPYKFEGVIENVTVKILCGFYAPLQNDNEDDEFDEMIKASSTNAGWTVSCNDRVVVYNDKTRLTGWGDSGIPLYHSQFRTFAGLVEFRSDDPGMLPMNTTKRGVDGNSLVYLETLESMRSGLRNFVNFTNKWKSDERVAKYFRNCVPATVSQIERANIPLRQVTHKPNQRAYNPDLPQPPSQNPVRRIVFARPQKQVELLAQYLELEEYGPSDVGESAFDYVFEEAKK